MASWTTLTDDDVHARISMADAIRKIETALIEKSHGTLTAPPRFRIEVNGGALVFTAGAATGPEQVIGFRVYDTFPDESAEKPQIVAVFDSATGRLKGICVGSSLGVMRTGAIGGVAVNAMSRADARVLAVIGTGRQARAQVEAASLVRPFRLIKVYSRSEERRRSFCQNMSDRLAATVEVASSARACLADADVVICATTSPTPVFEASWVKPGTHVQTLGPKEASAHELPPEILNRSAILATDSLAQLRSYPNPHIACGTPHEDRIVELSDIVAGRVPGRTSGTDVTVFFSVGLAGTEVVLANEAIRRATPSRTPDRFPS